MFKCQRLYYNCVHSPAVPLDPGGPGGPVHPIRPAKKCSDITANKAFIQTQEKKTTKYTVHAALNTLQRARTVVILTVITTLLL